MVFMPIEDEHINCYFILAAISPPVFVQKIPELIIAPDKSLFFFSKKQLIFFFIFFFGMILINPCPAEPGYTLFLQTV